LISQAITALQTGISQQIKGDYKKRKKVSIHNITVNKNSGMKCKKDYLPLAARIWRLSYT
jgi:hypothetical protein